MYLLIPDRRRPSHPPRTGQDQLHTAVHGAAGGCHGNSARGEDGGDTDITVGDRQQDDTPARPRYR